MVDIFRQYALSPVFEAIWQKHVAYKIHKNVVPRFYKNGAAKRGI